MSINLKEYLEDIIESVPNLKFPSEYDLKDYLDLHHALGRLSLACELYKYLGFDAE